MATCTPAIDRDDLLRHVRQSNGDLARAWFSDLQVLAVEYGVVRLGVPLDAQCRYLTNHCRSAFTDAARTLTGRLVAVTFEVHAAQGGEEEESTGRVPEAHFDALEPDFTFDNFVEGPENRFALAAVTSAAAPLGQAYNPLFLHGRRGTGKTHLVQSLCHALQEGDSPRPCTYLHANRLTHELIRALEESALPQWRGAMMAAEVLVIDDVHLVAGRERTQYELFRLLEHYPQTGRRLVLAGERDCEVLGDLQPRLLSRLYGGLVAELEEPCLETRLAIVRARADRMGVLLDESQALHMAETLEGQMHLLKQRVLAADAETRFLFKTQTKGTTSTIDLRLTRITECVAREFGLPRSDLTGNCRTPHVHRARQLCMYLSRTLTDSSLASIGRFFGGRGHSAVLHSIAAAKKRIQTEDRYQRLAAKLSAEVTHV